MPKPVLECVANCSEGTNLKVIDLLEEAITSVEGVKLLHRDVGIDANRTVFTFVGAPERVSLSAKQLATACAKHIDLRKYSGTHPYIGALDVCPFVPLFGLPLQAALSVAKEVAQYIGETLLIPTYLYEHAATRPEYHSLAAVRKGGLPAVALRSKDDGNGPDFGPSSGIHPTAGACVVGARDILVAYNINLTTKDTSLARKIAARVRSKGKGNRLPHIRAIGWYQNQFDCAQVSINLIKYKSTGIKAAFDAVTNEARILGIDTAGSEMIGLVPLDAMLSVSQEQYPTIGSEQAGVDAAIEYLGLNAVRSFLPQERILEWVV